MHRSIQSDTSVTAAGVKPCVALKHSVKTEGEGLNTWYSATYYTYYDSTMHLTVSEMTADWQSNQGSPQLQVIPSCMWTLY